MRPHRSQAPRRAHVFPLLLAGSLLPACGWSDWLLVFDEPFGRACAVVDNEDRPLADGDADGCPTEDITVSSDSELSTGYTCRSTGSTLDDGAVCAPNRCSTGPLHLVAPFQLADLRSLGVATAEATNPSPGGPGSSEYPAYAENCFAGLTAAPTAVRASADEASDESARAIDLRGLTSLAGDVVIDTRRVERESASLETEVFGIAQIRLPDLRAVSGRIVVAPGGQDYREDIVIVMDAQDGDEFGARDVVLSSLCAVNGSKRCDESPTTDNTPNVRIGGRSLASVDLSGFEHLDQLIIEDAASLESLQLPKLKSIAHRLILNNVGPDLVVTNADGVADEDRWGVLQGVELGSAWEPGRLEVSFVEVDDPREVIRLFLRLVENGFSGAVLIGNNPPQPTGDAAADEYWQAAPLTPIPAEQLCADLQPLSDDSLKCPQP